jgi:predicted acetyltransferase
MSLLPNPQAAVIVREGDRDSDWDRADALLRRVFGDDWPEAAAFLEVGAPKRLLLAELDGQLVGCVQARLRGLCLGSWTPPASTFDALGVLPECRQLGVGETLSSAIVRQGAADGSVFGLLRPGLGGGTNRYRRIGFELCGTWTERRVRPGSLRFPGAAASNRLVRVLSHADAEALARCYAEISLVHHGWMTRPPGFWTRLLDAASRQATIGTFDDLGALAGFATYAAGPRQAEEDCLTVSEIVWRQPADYFDLWRAIRQIAGDRDVTYTGGPTDLLFLASAEQPQVQTEMHWMGRILDVSRAMEGRSFPVPLAGTVELDLRDDLIEANRGCWRLSLAGGSGSIRRGGAGEAKISIGHLSALVFGYVTALELRELGYLDASPESVALLDAAFVAPRAWMSEIV